MRAKPALFLDRDGVINVERGRHIGTIADFEFMPGALELCFSAQTAGWEIIIITNQSAIAKGLFTLEQIEAVNAFMTQTFLDAGIKITELFCCPHHPDISRCFCRKPGTLFFERAIARFGVDATASWMLGDRARDLIPAKSLGIRTMGVGFTELFPEKVADFHVADTREALSLLFP